MTENKEIVDEKKKDDLVSIMHNFGEDHWIHTLTGGKQVKVFEDRRKKDKVIYKGIK